MQCFFDLLFLIFLSYFWYSLFHFLSCFIVFFVFFLPTDFSSSQGFFSLPIVCQISLPNIRVCSCHFPMVFLVSDFENTIGE